MLGTFELVTVLILTGSFVTIRTFLLSYAPGLQVLVVVCHDESKDTEYIVRECPCDYDFMFPVYVIIPMILLTQYIGSFLELIGVAGPNIHISMITFIVFGSAGSWLAKIVNTKRRAKVIKIAEITFGTGFYERLALHEVGYKGKMEWCIIKTPMSNVLTIVREDSIEHKRFLSTPIDERLQLYPIFPKDL